MSSGKLESEYSVDINVITCAPSCLREPESQPVVTLRDQET
jgi:hypothetical protein